MPENREPKSPDGWSAAIRRLAERDDPCSDARAVPHLPQGDGVNLEPQRVGPDPKEPREPVLSGERWRAVKHGTGGTILPSRVGLQRRVAGGLLLNDAEGGLAQLGPEDLPPLAAVLLDLLGIVSREDVEALLESPPDESRLQAFADRLEPYLPPKE